MRKPEPVLVTKYKCEKCSVYTSGTDHCKNCGAKRTGAEKKL